MTKELLYVEERINIPFFDKTSPSNNWVVKYKVKGKWVYEYCKTLYLAKIRYEFICESLRKEYRDLHPSRKIELNLKQKGK